MTVERILTVSLGDSAEGNLGEKGDSAPTLPPKSVVKSLIGKVSAARIGEGYSLR